MKYYQIDQNTRVKARKNWFWGDYTYYLQRKIKNKWRDRSNTYHDTHIDMASVISYLIWKEDKDLKRHKFYDEP